MTPPQEGQRVESEAAAWRQRWGLHTPATLRARSIELGSSNYLVEGLLPAKSIALLLGDSHIGKSPLVYQLGICVAAGIPFLGRPTRQGRVVIADFENGIGDALELIENIGRYLGLSGPPGEDRFLIWSANDCLPRYGQSGHTLLDMLRDVQPDLAIIDSLGSYNPTAEETNSAANELLKEFRRLGREHNSASIFVHHPRKQPRKTDERVGPIESADLHRWFQDSRGASALINGSDVRLGVGLPDLSAVDKDDLALVLRGFRRIRGEIGPLYVARDSDEEGQPVGYRLLTGPELLFNERQQRTLESLAERFSFRDAKRAYGRGDQPTRNFLIRCIHIGLIRQPSRGVYEKSSGESAAASGERGDAT